MPAGPLALVGGAEFQPGNEAQDRYLAGVASALPRERIAYIVATAAVRHGPEHAVEHARAWFAALGLPVAELAMRTRRQADDPRTAAEAELASFFYLCGGDPGIVPTTLTGTQGWAAVIEAWRGGAALAGSSAGAMALGEWTLIRARRPGDDRREPRPGLGVVPGIAVLPHFETFGHRWVGSAQEALSNPGSAPAVLVGIDERSAAVWEDGRWTAMGPGGVTVIPAIGDPAGRRFERGQRIEGLPSPQ